MIRGAETLTWACGPRWTPRQTPRRRGARPSPPSPPLPAGATLPTKTGLAERGRERELLKHWGIPSEGTPGENTICKCFLWPGYGAQPAPHRGRMLIYEILEPSLASDLFCEFASVCLLGVFLFFFFLKTWLTDRLESQPPVVYLNAKPHLRSHFHPEVWKKQNTSGRKPEVCGDFLRNTLEHKWV